MTFKTIVAIICSLLLLVSCAEDNDTTVPRNLQDYIDITFTDDFGEVIACAANAAENTSLTYIFYYPEVGASDIRYYEADSLDVDPNDFTNYRRQNLPIQDVFGGKLQRFSRTGATESWGLVTYVKDGKLHKSNPIRLKNQTKPTGWTDQVAITYPSTLTPKFTWSDFGVTDNVIYFQVVSKVEEDEFLSGTYTEEKTFQYFDPSNVVLNINIPETPEDLVADTEYQFTMMAVSEDNWVNTVIVEPFIPKNLQEYLNEHPEKTQETALAFGASNATNTNLSYVYYYPLVGATKLRYYETENATVDETNFSNYSRRNIADEAQFGGKLRRYSRESATERWAIITYIIEDVFYKSEPVRIKNQTKPTEWTTAVTIDDTTPLNPIFNWTDGSIQENVEYLQIFANATNNFLSGTFTTATTIQYGEFDNLKNINLETPPELVEEEEYKFTLFGLSDDNWVNLIIQKSYIVE